MSLLRVPPLYRLGTHHVGVGDLLMSQYTCLLSHVFAWTSAVQFRILLGVFKNMGSGP